MAAKQSLYELLGVSDKASPEEIRKSFEERRLELEQEPDSEDRRNRLAILQDAHSVLNDRRQRAGYDRRQRDRRQTAESLSPPPRSRWPALALLVILGSAYPAWRHFTASQPVVPAPAPQAAVVPAVSAEERPSISEDIAALLPPAPSGATAADAVPRTAAAAAPPQNLPRLVSEAPHAATLNKIADSTYLIIGGVGFGTGVAIERDKLLTNCHVIAPNVLKGPIFAISPITREKTRITEAAFLVTEDACVVHAPGLNAKPAVMGDAAQLTKGMPIFNIGFTDSRLIFSPGALLGVVNRGGQTYLVSSNYCDHGVSGGPLVDVEGRLMGLTSGGPRDRSFCLSLTAETARRVLTQTLIAIDAFPPNYMSNLTRRW